PDRRDRQQKQRAAPEQENDGENAFPVHGQRGGARRSASRCLASSRSAKSSRSCTSPSWCRSSSTSARNSATSAGAAFASIQRCSVCDHPVIHWPNAFPTGPRSTTTAPIVKATMLIVIAGAQNDASIRACPPPPLFPLLLPPPACLIAGSACLMRNPR